MTRRIMPLTLYSSFAVLLMFLSLPAFGEIPELISYQGKVTDGSGNPVPDGSYTMRFRIYDASIGGDLEWDSGAQSIAVSGGVFTVLLGDCPMPAVELPFDEEYWLLVTFQGIDQTPRQRLASTGYSYMASGLVPETVITGTVPNDDVLEVVNQGADGIAIKARAVTSPNPLEAGTAVYATTGGPGPAIEGRAETTSSGGVGVYGFSTSAIGVWGVTTDIAGSGMGADVGVWGEATTMGPSGSYGVYGKGQVHGGYFEGQYCGVQGSAWTTEDGGIGVLGVSELTTGSAHGGKFTVDSNEGIGVHGEATATDGTTYGVLGETASATGRGVNGESPYIGGRFKDTESGNYGYVGFSSYKVFGVGNVSFVQNHPNNDELTIVYSAPEGNEVATYTRGQARLVDGEARISLDETFRWVTNPDIGLTAHLTPRGAWAELYVKSLTPEELVVASRDGTGDAMFDYLVYGLRIGFEEASIVQEKLEESYIPSMKDHRDLYTKRPALRRYNALERFKNMRTAMGSTDMIDLSESRILRDAIEEYDSAVHGFAEDDVDRPQSRFISDQDAIPTGRERQLPE